MVDEWAERVGDKIAAVTEPRGVNNGVLFVGVASSAWLMELRMMEADIKRRLNDGRTDGRIRKIRFVMKEREPRGPGWGRGRGEE